MGFVFTIFLLELCVIAYCVDNYNDVNTGAI